MSANPTRPPLIPEALFDVPSQRLYALSFAAFLQALKAFDVFTTIVASDSSKNYLLKWILIDTAFIWLLPLLRIPRLTFLRKYRLLQILILVSIDWALLGDYKLSLTSFVPSQIRDQFSWERSVTERLVRIQSVVQSGGHLVGQHTVRMSPISTARLNPYGQSYCLGPPDYSVLIPVVTNNTKPTRLQYSIAPLGDQGPRTYIDITSKELKAIENSRAALKQAQLTEEEQEERFDELFDEDEAVEQRQRIRESSPYPPLSKTEALWHIRVNKPGVVRLERGVDSTDSEVRIRQSEVTVVQCPSAEFIDSLGKGDAVRCVGSTEELSLKVYGVTPLSLKWNREILGRRQPFMVDGIEGNHEVDRLPLAQELKIPLSLTLDAPGKHKYTLDALVDGVGNAVDLSMSPKEQTMRTVTVLGRAAMSFKNCGAGRPVNLFKGTESRLSVISTQADKEDGPWDITIKYVPPAGDSRKGWTRDFTTKPGHKDLDIPVSAPGDYTIVSVRGKHCAGDVLSPETCRVVELPLPAADIEYKRTHECSVATGVAVSLLLHGTPPFEIHYTTQRNREAEKPATEVVHGSRGEIILQPTKSGSYTYTFKSISDVNYKKVKLDGPTINQVIHRLASAEFADAGQSSAKTMLSSCSGSLVDIPVNLDGTPPWNVEIQVVGPKETKTFQMPGITKSQEIIHLPIPPEIDQEGGTFQVDLVSVEDANGCKRSLAVKGLSVNVKRVKPTAKFYTSEGRRQVTVLEGQTAKLPLRLTGEGPWQISYRLLSDPSKTDIVTVKAANENMVVKQTGTYELIDVRDSHCPGSILVEESRYVVDWVPRPIVRLSPASKVTLASNGSYIRAPVCENTEDHVDLDLKGRPPFQISYNVARETEAGGLVVMEQPTANSIQTTTRVPLRTKQPGRIYYEVSAIGDSAYPLDSNGGAESIPASKRLQFEQQVLARPSAQFKTETRLSYCLTDALIPRPNSDLDNNGLIVLKGHPPFTLHLTIKNIGASETRKEVIQVDDHEWKLNFPDYIFHTVGPHLVTIDRVLDQSGCDEMDESDVRRSVWVDVAETAMIVPFDRREAFCVGDVLQFQLEGTPPWRIKYRFNGKMTTATAKHSQFRRVAESPGTFNVVSIAHQQNLCQTTVSDVKVVIHDIPSAHVSQGKNIIEDIREGDQAEIVFTLIGEPPFTFTYQRTELEQYAKRPKSPKVLETHTVSGVMTHEYSIFSAMEGTWTVTFISDKHCRYPPAQADPSVERA